MGNTALWDHGDTLQGTRTEEPGVGSAGAQPQAGAERPRAPGTPCSAPRQETSLGSALGHLRVAAPSRRAGSRQEPVPSTLPGPAPPARAAGELGAAGTVPGSAALTRRPAAASGSHEAAAGGSPPRRAPVGTAFAASQPSAAEPRRRGDAGGGWQLMPVAAQSERQREARGAADSWRPGQGAEPSGGSPPRRGRGARPGPACARGEAHVRELVLHRPARLRGASSVGTATHQPGSPAAPAHRPGSFPAFPSGPEGLAGAGGDRAAPVLILPTQCTGAGGSPQPRTVGARPGMRDPRTLRTGEMPTARHRCAGGGLPCQGAAAHLHVAAARPQPHSLWGQAPSGNCHQHRAGQVTTHRHTAPCPVSPPRRRGSHLHSLPGSELGVP